MFEKFLAKKPEKKPEEAQTARRPRGRPRKADADLKYPRKDPSRYSKITGRLLPSKRKYKLKKPQYRHSRKVWRARRRKQRLQAGYRARETAYTRSLWRKYLQNRSVGSKRAQYSLTYDDWLVLWATTPDVDHPIKGRCRAAEAQNNFLRDKSATYVDRLDKSKPYTRDNVAVFQYGKPLPNQLNK